MLRGLDPERFKAPIQNGLEAWIADGLQRPSERWLVAEIDGQIAGYAVGAITEPHAQADLKMLTDAQATRLGIRVVHTSEVHLRKGVATALIRALERGYERTSVRFRKRLAGGPGETRHVRGQPVRA